ncbi:MAG: DNA polymerase III subunit alpha [Pseudomonadota bacterium]
MDTKYGFSHLHLHTQYSLLDSTIKISDLIETVKKLDMDSVAITDHGNLMGAIEFYKEAKKQDIKAIIGSEVYIAQTGRFDKSTKLHHHLVLLAENNTGYINLIKLVSIGYTEGYYNVPRIDNEVLRQHSEGLIGLSGCMGGEIPHYILRDELSTAIKAAMEYKTIFGAEAFYLELLETGLSGQKKVNDGLIHISKECNIPLVATNNCHYLKKEEHQVHAVLSCIQAGKTLDEIEIETDQLYLKSAHEMLDLFKDHPEAIQNTKKIADRCNVEIELGRKQLPHFQTPEKISHAAFLEKLAFEGLDMRFDTIISDRNISKYTKRLKHELEVINNKGFAAYFLVVWDYVKYAMEAGIPVGPGRGSSPGCLVAYLLGITDIDPVRYSLHFERFLNPDRDILPDFDIDFGYDQRDEVIEYITKKCGKNKVSKIITYVTFRARSVIRDVGRALNIPYDEVDKVVKLLSEFFDMSLERALELKPELNKIHEKNKIYQDLIRFSFTLEGLKRHTGVHTCGIVISPKALTQYIPLYCNTSGDQISQFTKDELEDIGLVKFDILGLKALTVLDNACKLINKNGDEIFDIKQILHDDPKVFELLTSGNTSGVFQFESCGIKDIIKKIKPDCFEDIIAAYALYRPGPLASGMTEDFWKRKHGLIASNYPHPKLEDILKVTYGIIVYQEQIMEAASRIAGLPFQQADILRRIMGKKKANQIEKQKEIFVEGARKNDISYEKANEIFDLLEYYSGYGFNKAHAAAYALISYRCAYLKCHYPMEYSAALISSEKDNPEKALRYLKEWKSMN